VIVVRLIIALMLLPWLLLLGGTVLFLELIYGSFDGVKWDE
jgi:hypothetical protein